MVQEQLRGRGIRDERVLSAMSKVPREEFAPAESLSQAYGDYPLPIGAGQTVSQPYIVASMIEALAVRPSDRVLEIGTGTGYEAAILGELAAEIWTSSAFPNLRAKRRILARLGYENVHVVEGDGSVGLLEHAPYPKILVAAAAPAVPQSLVDQLAEGGSLVIPIGSRIEQQIHLVRKDKWRGSNNSSRTVPICSVAGKEGWTS